MVCGVDFLKLQFMRKEENLREILKDTVYDFLSLFPKNNTSTYIHTPIWIYMYSESIIKLFGHYYIFQLFNNSRAQFIIIYFHTLYYIIMWYIKSHTIYTFLFFWQSNNSYIVAYINVLTHKVYGKWTSLENIL